MVGLGSPTDLCASPIGRRYRDAGRATSSRIKRRRRLRRNRVTLLIDSVDGGLRSLSPCSGKQHQSPESGVSERHDQSRPLISETDMAPYN